jgi:hypothetical protein
LVGSIAPGRKGVSYRGVHVDIPATWPVLDGALAHFNCSSEFANQADRAFIGNSYQSVPSCPASLPGSPVPPADGVWLQPGGSSPSGTPMTLPGGSAVRLTPNPRSAAVAVWFHNVLIELGVGPDPALQRQILDSIRFRKGAPDTAVLGGCPAPQPNPVPLPTATRLTAPLAVDDGNATMQPEPSTVVPRVDAASVWADFITGFGAGRGPLQWSIVFGRYSAKTPATINPDGSSTPDFRGVPAWLIRGQGVKTQYGSCGITIIAPYNADTGRSMGVEMTG